MKVKILILIFIVFSFASCASKASEIKLAPEDVVYKESVLDINEEKQENESKSDEANDTEASETNLTSEAVLYNESALELNEEKQKNKSEPDEANDTETRKEGSKDTDIDVYVNDFPVTYDMAYSSIKNNRDVIFKRYNTEAFGSMEPSIKILDGKYYYKFAIRDLSSPYTGSLLAIYYVDVYSGEFLELLWAYGGEELIPFDADPSVIHH